MPTKQYTRRPAHYVAVQWTGDNAAEVVSTLSAAYPTDLELKDGSLFLRLMNGSGAEALVPLNGWVLLVQAGESAELWAAPDLETLEAQYPLDPAPEA